MPLSSHLKSNAEPPKLRTQSSTSTNLSTKFVQVQQKLYSHAARILEAIKTTKVWEAGEKQWILSLPEEVVSYTR